MTDAAKKSRHHAVTVGYATIALFVAIFAVLLFRLEAGLDPSIGTAAYKVPPVEQRQLVVKRKVIVREEVQQPEAAPAVVASAPAVSSVPAQSAPAPAAAPVPAPAPAPAPTTSAS